MARPGLFFTATDTDAGKTYVVAGVARELRRHGRAVAVRKPIATGAEWDGTAWRSRDTRMLAEAAGTTDLQSITLWAFQEPAAPPVAARAAHCEISLDQIVVAVGETDIETTLLVEGIGGLLCPLTASETVADLARVLNLPMVIVARRSLGTLNHTLLTVEAAQRRRLPVAGVIVTETSPVTSVAEQTNVEELRKRISVPILGVLPHRKDERVHEDFGVVDWYSLARSNLSR